MLKKESIKIIGISDLGNGDVEIHAQLGGIYNPADYESVYRAGQFETRPDGSIALIPGAEMTVQPKPDAQFNVVTIRAAKANMLNVQDPDPKANGKLKPRTPLEILDHAKDLVFGVVSPTATQTDNNALPAPVDLGVSG